jgi:hypothetical protein
MDRHHCYLLPHLICQRQGNGPLSQLHPHYGLALIQCFTHFSSENLVFKFKIILSVGPL